MLGRLLSDVIGTLKERQPAAPPREAGRVIELDPLRCLVKARHGWFLANRYDVYLGAALIRYGEYSEIELAFLSALLGAGDVVIEVGANSGTHTVGLGKAVGPAGAVVAVEAQPAIFRVLCANVALNGLQNVACHALGCGERRETRVVPALDYEVPVAHNSGSVSLAAAGAGINVPVVPLDELAASLPRVRLIKVDVEGMELEVLRGASKSIDRCRPRLYVENDRFDRSAALIEWIRSKGYRLYWHFPPLFNPANHAGVAEDDYPGIVSANMFCQPKEEAPAPGTAGLREITDPAHHPLR